MDQYNNTAGAVVLGSGGGGGASAPQMNVADRFGIQRRLPSDPAIDPSTIVPGLDPEDIFLTGGDSDDIYFRSLQSLRDFVVDAKLNHGIDVTGAPDLSNKKSIELTREFKKLLALHQSTSASLAQSKAYQDMVLEKTMQDGGSAAGISQDQGFFDAARQRGQFTPEDVSAANRPNTLPQITTWNNFLKEPASDPDDLQTKVDFYNDAVDSIKSIGQSRGFSQEYIDQQISMLARPTFNEEAYRLGIDASVADIEAKKAGTEGTRANTARTIQTTGFEAEMQPYKLKEIEADIAQKEAAKAKLEFDLESGKTLLPAQIAKIRAEIKGVESDIATQRGTLEVARGRLALDRERLELESATARGGGSGSSSSSSAGAKGRPNAARQLLFETSQVIADPTNFRGQPVARSAAIKGSDGQEIGSVYRLQQNTISGAASHPNPDHRGKSYKYTEVMVYNDGRRVARLVYADDKGEQAFLAIDPNNPASTFTSSVGADENAQSSPFVGIGQDDLSEFTNKSYADILSGYGGEPTAVLTPSAPPAVKPAASTDKPDFGMDKGTVDLAWELAEPGASGKFFESDDEVREAAIALKGAGYTEEQIKAMVKYWVMHDKSVESEK